MMRENSEAAEFMRQARSALKMILLTVVPLGIAAAMAFLKS